MIRVALTILLTGVALTNAAEAAPGAPVGQPTAAAMKVACTQLDGMDSSRVDSLIFQLRQLYHTDQFKILDETLACLMASKARLRSGKPAASIAYQLFKREMPAPDPSPAAGAQNDKWRRALPSSPFARFAQLRLLYSNAWDSRGGDYAGEVTDEGWAQFQKGLLKAENGMLKAQAPLRGSPIWHHLLIALVQDNGGPAARPEALFEEAIKQWPQYYDYYDVRLTRKVPKWGGSWELVEQFIDRWSVKQKADEGDSLYARLYASVHLSGVDPSETKHNWPRMKASLDDLVTRYPDSRHKVLAASYACRYGDVAYFKTSIARLGAEDVSDGAWLRGTSMSICSLLARNQTSQ